MLAKIAHHTRQVALNVAVRPMLNAKYRRYATIKTLTYDAIRGTARITAVLAGETREDEIHLTRLEIQTQGDDTYLVVHSVTASRPWIEALANDYLVDRPIKLPPALAALL